MFVIRERLCAHPVVPMFKVFKPFKNILLHTHEGIHRVTQCFFSVLLSELTANSDPLCRCLNVVYFILFPDYESLIAHGFASVLCSLCDRAALLSDHAAISWQCYHYAVQFSQMVTVSKAGKGCICHFTISTCVYLVYIATTDVCLQKLLQREMKNHKESIRKLPEHRNGSRLHLYHVRARVVFETGSSVQELSLPVK